MACNVADDIDILLSLLLSMVSAAVVVHGVAAMVLTVAVVVGYVVRGGRMVVQLVVVGAMPIYVVRVVLIPDGMWCGWWLPVGLVRRFCNGCQNWPKRGEKALICRDNVCV